MYTVEYTKRAVKQIPLLNAVGLDETAKFLIEILRENPYKNPPEYEKLVGNLKGAYSRRLNHKHRLVYEVDEKEKIVKIISMWLHYE